MLSFLISSLELTRKPTLLLSSSPALQRSSTPVSTAKSFSSSNMASDTATTDKARSDGSSITDDKNMASTEPAGSGESTDVAQKEKDLYPMSNWKYDTFLWSVSFLADIFFREIHPRGSWKVPRKGPVLFVAAPHNNQVGFPTRFH